MDTLYRKTQPDVHTVSKALEMAVRFAYQAPPGLTHYDELVNFAWRFAQEQQATAVEIHLNQALGQRVVDAQSDMTQSSEQARNYFVNAYRLAERYQLDQAQADSAFKLNQLEYRLSYTHYLNAWVTQLKIALAETTSERFEAIYQRIEPLAQQLMCHALWDEAKACFQRLLDHINAHARPLPYSVDNYLNTIEGHIK